MNLKRCLWVLAVVVGMGVTGGTMRADDPDYSKNRNYQQGMREGHTDYTHKKDHSKKHHFKKDEDQKAYEAGYQKGHDH